MNYYKQLGKNRKKDELPSFLVGLTDAPEDITFSPKPNPSSHYLGPIFFGLCTNYQHHAPPHSLKLGSFHQPQYIMFHGSDDISKLLYPQSKSEKLRHSVKTLKQQPVRQRIIHDMYPHKCPGGNKMFTPEVTPHVINLGKTQSIIEGEAVYEIPLSRARNVAPRYRRKSSSKTQNEFLTLSDIREERRKFMSYKERIAHAHFPKEFATVRVVGPTIPASITITKLPSKRKTESELTVELKSGTQSAEITKEIQKGMKSTSKSKSVSTSSSKKLSRKSEIQSSEYVEKAEEDIENEAFIQSQYLTEKEEIYEEGAEREEEIEEEAEQEEEEEEKVEREERKETKPEIKEEAKAEVKEEAKTEIKEETKTEIKEETKTEIKEEPKTEIKEEAKTEVKEETKTEIKEEPKTEIKEEPKTEIKEEPKTEVKEESKTEVKEETKTEAKEETKPEVKEEPKTEVKEEPKAEEKEEEKPEVKEETKTEVKEEKAKVIPLTMTEQQVPEPEATDAHGENDIDDESIYTTDTVVNDPDN